LWIHNTACTDTNLFPEHQLRDARAELDELREARDAKYVEVVSSLQLSQDQVKQLQDKVVSLNSEQEDLLVMLADQVRPDYFLWIQRTNFQFIDRSYRY
jgi:hypothetical protein